MKEPKVPDHLTRVEMSLKKEELRQSIKGLKEEFSLNL